MKEYALYKGDDLLSIGTLEELSKEFNVKTDTLLFYSYNSYKKRTKDSKSRRLVCLDE